MSVTSTESTRIAHWLLDGVTETVTTYVNDKASTMIEIIGPLATFCLSLFVLLWGVAMASGQISEPFTDGMRRIIRICLITGLALTAGVYQNMVADLFLSAPNQIASQMVFEGSAGASDARTLADTLDNTMQKGMDVGDQAWDKGDEMAQMGIRSAIAAVGYYAVAILVYLASVIIVAIAAAILFTAFVAMAVLLAIGPLFILMAIFPQTYRWFESWLGQLVNYALLYVIVAVTVGLVFAFFEKFLTDLPVSTFDELVINALKLIGAVMAVLTVLLQTRSIAAALGGGAAMTAQNVAGRLASYGTSATRAVVTGHSRRGIAGQTNAAAVGRSGVSTARRALDYARRTFTAVNTVEER